MFFPQSGIPFPTHSLLLIPFFFKGPIARATLFIFFWSISCIYSFPFSLLLYQPQVLALWSLDSLPMGFSLKASSELQPADLFSVTHGGCLLLLQNPQWLFPKSIPLQAHTHIYHFILPIYKTPSLLVRPVFSLLQVCASFVLIPITQDTFPYLHPNLI